MHNDIYLIIKIQGKTWRNAPSTFVSLHMHEPNLICNTYCETNTLTLNIELLELIDLISTFCYFYVFFYIILYISKESQYSK